MLARTRSVTFAQFLPPPQLAASIVAFFGIVGPVFAGPAAFASVTFGGGFGPSTAASVASWKSQNSVVPRLHPSPGLIRK
jgi:hypothetical protein